METNSLQVVVEALKLTAIADNNQQILEATKVLAQQSCKPGYIRILASIAREKQFELQVLLAAFAQLKGILKNRWHGNLITDGRKKTAALTEEDRSFLIGSIIQMNIVHVDNYTLFKLTKDINCGISDDILAIIPQVIDLLTQQRHFKPCLNILLGMSENLRLENSFALRQKYSQILNVVLPLVLSVIHSEQQKLIDLYWKWDNGQTKQLLIEYNIEKKRFEELLYLSIKFAYKSIGNDISIQLRRLYCQWAKISLGRIEEQNEEYNAVAKEQPSFCGQRGSDMFNYFHGKKWSAKFMNKFMNKVLEIRRSKPQTANLTHNFFDQYGEYLRNTLKITLQTHQPIQVRCNELSLLQNACKWRIDIMRPDIHFYLFENLPQYLDLSDEDLHNLQNNANDFMIAQSPNERNQKLLAVSIWKGLAMIGCSGFQFGRKGIEGDLLILCFNKINDWLHEEQWRWQQIALYLLIQFGSNIIDYPQSFSIVRVIIQLCLPNIFHQPCLALQLRGFQLISAFPNHINDEVYPILQEVILNLFQNRQKIGTNSLDLLAIHAGIALDKILIYGSKVTRKFQGQEIIQVLSTVLQLLNNYEITELSDTITAFLQEYPSEMSKYSIDLAVNLAESLKMIMEKDVENAAGRYIQSVTGIVDVFMLITRTVTKEGSINHPLKHVIEEKIIGLANYALSFQQRLQGRYIDGILQLLSTYLNVFTNIPHPISDPISFFFLALIFRFTPFNQFALTSIAQSTRFSPECRQILQQSKDKDELQLQMVFQLMRNYLKFINPQCQFLRKNCEISPHIADLDFLNQFFYMVNYYYRGKEENSHIDPKNLKGRYLITVTLSSLLEHHASLPLPVYSKIIKIVQLNSMQSDKMKTFFISANLQLFCAWVTNYEGAVNFLSKQEKLIAFITKLFYNSLKGIQKDIRRTPARRIIMGMIKLIQFSYVIEELECVKAYFFTWIFYFIMKELEFDEEPEPITEYPAHEEQYCPPSPPFPNSRDLDLDFQIDEDCNEDYTPMHNTDHFKYFLDFLIVLRGNFPDFYEEFILQGYYYKVQTIAKYAQTKYSPHYQQLFTEQDLNFQQR